MSTGNTPPSPTDNPGEDSKQKTFTQAEVDAIAARERNAGREAGRRQAHADLFEELKPYGIDTKEKLVTSMKAADEARRAQLSEAEKIKEDNKRLQAERDTWEKSASAAKKEAERIRLFSENGIDDMEVAELLYEKAAAEAEAKKEAFDGKAWVARMQTDEKRKGIFRQQAAAPQGDAKAGQPQQGQQRAPATTTFGGNAPPAPTAGAKPFNAATATDAEVVEWERANGIAPRR